MLAAKTQILFGTIILSLLLGSLECVFSADSISPSQEQEFTDAKGALDAAKKAEGEIHATAYIKQAVDFIEKAEKARSIPDFETFSRASRLARAYAELAKASAELNADLARLAQIRDALAQAKADIESLKK